MDMNMRLNGKAGCRAKIIKPFLVIAYIYVQEKIHKKHLYFKKKLALRQSSHVHRFSLKSYWRHLYDQYSSEDIF